MGNFPSLVRGFFFPEKVPEKVTLFADLSDYFSTITLVKGDVANAVSKLKTAEFEENMDYDVTIGYPIRDFDQLVKDLIVALNIKNEQEKEKFRSKLNKARAADSTTSIDSKTSKIEEIQFFGECTSYFGYLASIKPSKVTISVAYVFHKLYFKTSDTVHIEDMDEIKKNYGKFKCLETLERQGLIKSINYK